MERVAKFSKVSFEEYAKSFKKIYGDISDEEIKIIYDKIKLPTRATKGSAGYDFFAPMHIYIDENSTAVIPTGIRCEIKEGWVLEIYPRSGMGFRTCVRLANTVGIIDSDYFYSDNEGHIMVKLTNGNLGFNGAVELYEGAGFCQGVFKQYGITEDDNADGIRNGGFGSTTK